MANYKRSNKNKRDILVDEEQYEYREHRKHGETVYYYCRRRSSDGCPATAKVNDGLLESLTVMKEHNHGSNVVANKVEEIIKSNLERSARCDQLPVRTVVAQICSEAQKQGIPTDQLPTTNTLKKRIHRARNKHFGDPPTPKVSYPLSCNILYSILPHCIILERSTV